MPLLARKGPLAITAVLDIALSGAGRPVAAKALADRHGLPPRHLEPVLQALVHSGILKGIRGPRGGYELARDPAAISIEEIVRAAGADEEADDLPVANSSLYAQIVIPALSAAENAFASALRATSIDDLRRAAQRLAGGAPPEG